MDVATLIYGPIKSLITVLNANIITNAPVVTRCLIQCCISDWHVLLIAKAKGWMSLSNATNGGSNQYAAWDLGTRNDTRKRVAKRRFCLISYLPDHANKRRFSYSTWVAGIFAFLSACYIQGFLLLFPLFSLRVLKIVFHCKEDEEINTSARFQSAFLCDRAHGNFLK